MIKKLSFCILLLNLLSLIAIGQTSDTINSKIKSNNINQIVQIDSALVIASFIVNTTGEISRIKIIKFKCNKCSRKDKKGLKSEVIRVIRSFPYTEPPKVRTKFILPIKFKLPDK